MKLTPVINIIAKKIACSILYCVSLHRLIYLQGCTPCINTNDRLVDPEMQSSCLMPPPQMQTYHGMLVLR